MKKQIISSLFLGAALAFLPSCTFAATPASNTIHKVFGDAEDHPKRNKLKTAHLNNTDEDLEKVRKFLLQFDFTELAQRARKKDKASLVEQARELKKEQLRRIFPLPSAAGKTDPQSYLTNEDIQSLVENVSLKSFKTQWNYHKLGTEYSPIKGYKAPAYSLPMPKGDGPTHSPKNTSSLSIPQLISGSLIGAGIVWFIYNKWLRNEKKDIIHA